MVRGVSMSRGIGQFSISDRSCGIFLPVMVVVVYEVDVAKVI